MGKRENNLRQILTESGIIKEPKLAVPRIRSLVLLDDLGEYGRTVQKVFSDLGGKDGEIDFRSRWDIFGDQYIIELDEELHFNQYRLLTLNSPLYKCGRLKPFPLEKYKGFCQDYSEKCKSAGSFGRKWRTDRSVVMFGAAGNPGDLSGNGSPRWKQRAFYDFIKDMSILVTNIPVVRLSIYDKIEYQGDIRMLGDVLDLDKVTLMEVANPILETIEQRLP